LSTSIGVVGLKPVDEKYLSYKDIWDKCEKLKISIPKEVSIFFNGDTPDGNGIEVSIYKVDGCVREYNESGCEGYLIDITKLPKDVKVIKTYKYY